MENRIENKGKSSKQTDELIEIVCPKCRVTKIIHFPREGLPLCPKCGIEMAIKELLTEGKSY